MPKRVVPHRFLNLIFPAVLIGRLTAEEPRSIGDYLRDLKPGSTVEVPARTFTTKKFRSLQGLRGTASQPITIRAAQRGQTVIAGEAGLILRDCEYVMIEGFVFENDADQQSVQLDNCRQVRLTRNIFRPKERAKPRHWEHWVTVDGANSGHNRIDHNLFDRKVNRGSPLFIRGDDAALVCSQHDQIDHNHFRDVVYANGENGHETIRTGGNDLGASGRSSFTTIEHNLLERCSGEDEIISLKSSDNVFRGNTLINCRGAVCLRLGNRTEASGNIIIATEEGPGFGGIKLFGFEHRVTDNYFSGLTGRKHEAPFSLFPGMYDTPTTENIGPKYDDMTAGAATHCVVTNNTWVDCAPLQIGLEKEEKKWVHTPNGCVFGGNRIIRSKPQPKPILISGLVRDLRAKENTSNEPLPPDTPWSSWFRGEKDVAPVKTPKPLTPAEVGPEAEEKR